MRGYTTRATLNSRKEPKDSSRCHGVAGGHARHRRAARRPPLGESGMHEAAADVKPGPGRLDRRRTCLKFLDERARETETLTTTTYTALAASAPSTARPQRQPLTYHELQLALPDLDVPFAIAEPQQLQRARELAGELAARRGEIPLTALQSSSAWPGSLPMAACHCPSTPLSSCTIVINSSPPT